MICCCALSEPCGVTFGGLPLFRSVLVVFLCHFVLHLGLCPKMAFLISFGRLFVRRVLAERWVCQLKPIVSGESPPLLHSLRIGQCLVCWLLLPGAPIRCPLPSTSGIYNLSTKACVPWVRSWLLVNRLGSSHLCLLCSRGRRRS